MKTQILYIFLFALIISSCESKKNIATTDQPIKLIEMERLAEHKIGTGNNSDFQLAVTESSLLDAATKFIMDNNEGKRVSYKYKIETIDSNRFLRLYREDGKITTIAINYNSKNGTYFTGNTICTSSSKSNGCIPDGKACSKIDDKNSAGQCTKTSVAYTDSQI